MARQQLGRRVIATGIASILALSALAVAAAPPPAQAATVSRWSVENQSAAGDTHGWFTDDSGYPISVFPIDQTIPGYDPDTIIVYGGSVHLSLIGPDGEPITAGSYSGVTDLLSPTPGHAAMGYYDPEAYCGGWTGTLDIWTLERDVDGKVTSLSADYAASCSAGISVRGQVRFNDPRPVAALVDSQWSGTYGDAFVGQGPVGQHEETALHYTNRGDTTLHLGTPALTGADAADFEITGNTCAPTLAPSAACDITVRFTASTTAIEHATLTFTTDTPMGLRRLGLYGLGVTPTTTSLTGPGGYVIAGDVLAYDGQVTPAPAGGDPGGVQIMFTEASGGSSREMAQVPLAADGTFHAEFAISEYLPAMTYHVTAHYQGGYGGNWCLPSDSPPASDVTVRAATLTTIGTSLNPALSTVPVKITATVWAGGTTISGGTLSIVDEADGSTIASGPVAGTTLGTLEVTRTFTTGTHHLVAHYSGDDAWAPSEAAIDQVITKDQAVAASGLGVTPSTFYPVKDGYRDTLTVRGTFKEPGTVAVKVVSVATGRTVRSISLGSVSGAYHWAWDGRTAAGAMVPAGKYKVVQTLRDTAPNTLVSTSYATVSLKRLYWSSASVTLTGRQYFVSGKDSGGTVSTSGSAYAGGVKLASGNGGWAGVSYRFPCKTASVYGNVTFKVQGRASGSGQALIALWNPGAGSYLYTSSYDTWKAVGPAYGWYATTAPLSYHHAGGYIRTTVLVDASFMRAAFDVARVVVTYRYGVLR